MPRKKIVRKVVDKKDEPIEPKEALKMLGIVTNNETALDAPVETAVIEEFVKQDTAAEEVTEVIEVPEVHVPQVYDVTMSYKAGAFEHPEIVGYARYHELTNSLTLGSHHPRYEAIFSELVKSDLLVQEDGVDRLVQAIHKKEWITSLCKATLGYRLIASEPRTYNEVG